MISQTTPAGLRPARRARSTAASVWPARRRTPPSRARSGKTCPGWTRSLGPRRRVDRDLDRVRAVVRRDAGRDALPGLDGHRERGAERRLVPVGHLAQPELVAALLGEAEADEAARVRDHEVDGLRRRELRGDREIALVLAILVVDDDDELAGTDVLDRLLDRREGILRTWRDHQTHARIVPGSSFSTYLARTSTSRFTGSPGARGAEGRHAPAYAARARSRTRPPGRRRSSARRRRLRSSPSRRSSA